MGAALKKPPVAPGSAFTLNKELYDADGFVTLESRAQGAIRYLNLQYVVDGSNRRFLGQHQFFPLMGSISRRSEPVISDASDDAAQGGMQGCWEGLLAYIEEWSRLGDDWDGEGGRAPSDAVISSVREMIATLDAQNAPVPRIYIVGDGEIGLRWENGSFYASASFVDEGDLLLYMHEGDTVLHDCDVTWSADLDLQSFIRDIVRVA